MKLLKVVVCLTAVLMLSQSAFGGAETPAMDGTAHDLRARISSTEYCIPCHTPHNAFPGSVPLWNHEDSGEAFTPYPSGGSMQSTPTIGGAESASCFGCHDGVIGVDAFGGVTPGTDPIVGTAVIDADLTNDHPIGMTYDDTLVGTGAGQDPELRLPSTYVTLLGGTIQDDLLFSDRMECATCHEVHGNAITGLLKIDNAASALCLTCHDK
ncbi:MAG: cytochrome c3 family protein [Planctomycetota bacterium]|jgi:predicted CXXCH cytochrome family protein